MLLSAGLGSKRASRIAIWVSVGRLGSVVAGGRGFGGLVVVVMMSFLV